MEMVALLILGLLVGAFGTLIGAGGGFLLTPVMAICYPGMPPGVLTAISLAVVLCNATSGSIAYARMGRVDYRAGISFGLASLPGAVIGAVLTGYIQRSVFDALLGGFLIVMAGYLFWRSFHPIPSEAGSAAAPRGPRWYLIGCGVSLFVGLLASFLGIGGGIIHVPLLVYVLGFPVHRATATSHQALAMTALMATGVHVWGGELSSVWMMVLPLGVGAIIGAQVGARLAQRVKAHKLERAMAGALVLVGLRMVWAGARPHPAPIPAAPEHEGGQS
jgi:hypothetical protein